MGRNLRSTMQMAMTVPLGAPIEVMRAGVNYKATGTAVARAAYPELSAAFPVSGQGFFAADSNASLTGTWAAITFGNNVFVAVGEAGRIGVSQDGQSWTVMICNAAMEYTDVIWANNQFVAVGGLNGCATSPDGYNWTARVLPTAQGSTYYRQIAYGAGLYVAVPGRQGDATTTYATSPNGINWTARVLPYACSWRLIRFGDGQFVAMASYNSNIYATSADGINWTQRAGPALGNWEVLIYAGGQWVALCGGWGMSATTQAITSPNGINWTVRTLASAALWTDIAYGNGFYLAVGTNINSANSVMLTSKDAITWVQRNAPAQEYRAAGFANGLFVALQGYRQTMTPAPTGVTVYVEGNTSEYLYLSGPAGKFIRVS